MFHVKHCQNKPKTGKKAQKHPKKTDFGGFQKVFKQKRSKAKSNPEPQSPMKIPPENEQK